MNETVERLIPLFEKVAAKIGDGAAFSWTVLVRQQYVDAIMYGVWAVITLVLAAALLWVGRPREHVRIRTSDDVLLVKDADCWIASRLCYIGALFGALSIACAVAAVGRLVNPEFYAIRFLMGLVK